MRSHRSLPLLCAAVLLLSGCGTVSDPTWRPPDWRDHQLRIATASEPLDPASLGALSGARLRNDDIGVGARFSLLPGSGAFDQRITAMVRDAIGARAAVAARAYAPQVFPRGAGLGDRGCVRGSTLRPAVDVLADATLGPANGGGTAVVCDLVAAAGSVIGQRVRIVSGDATSVTADTSSIVYADVAAGLIGSADELWAPEASGRLRDEVVEMLRREAGALSLAPVAPGDHAALAAFTPALATTVPGTGGSLAVTVPAGFTAPELHALGVAPTAEPLTLEVSASLTETLVTPLGAALVSAGATAAPFVAPAAVPAGDAAIDCDLFPCVALTYDDGPSDLTPGILDALAARRGAATFFVMGEKASAYADVMRRAIAEGHLVENHTWNHPRLRALSLDAARRQIHDATRAIEKQTGERITMFRPPYGQYTAAILSAAELPAILWDVDTFDWQGIADDVLISRAVDQPRPGSIVLQHDIQANTGRTAAAVYDGLLDRGFSLVTVSQLFDGKVPASGAWRSGR